MIDEETGNIMDLFEQLFKYPKYIKTWSQQQLEMNMVDYSKAAGKWLWYPTNHKNKYLPLDQKRADTKNKQAIMLMFLSINWYL